MFRRHRVFIILSAFIVCFLLWQYRDTFQNPALFGDDYMNTSRSSDISPGQRLIGFLAPNNSYDNRPLGNLLYITLYRTFGARPMPYIVLLFALHAVNAVLGFFLASRVLNNRYLGALASLAWAINFNLANNVYSFNVIYDNLTFFWWTSSFLLYLRNRENESKWAFLGALICFFLSTRAKEVGAMLPLSLLAYEISSLESTPWRDRHGFRTMLERIVRKQWPFHLISLLYVVFYMRHSAWGIGSLPQHPYYMDLSFRAFMEGMKYYMSCVTFSHPVFRSSVLLFLGFGVLFVWAALLRRRVLWWALVTYLVALLPVIFFVNSRAQIYLYVPLFSLILTLAGLAGHTVLRVLERWRTAGTWAAYAVTALIFLQYWKTDEKYLGYIGSSFAVQRAIANEVVSDLLRCYPAVPAGARFYFQGLPPEITNPDLFLDHMPRLVYRDSLIRSFRIGSKDEALHNERRQDGGFFCYIQISENRDGGLLPDRQRFTMVDRTAELTALLRPGPPTTQLTLQPHFRTVRGVRLRATPGRIKADFGGSIEYRVTGLRSSTIDVLYTLNNEPQPPILGWRLGTRFHAHVRVSPETRKGVYRIVGIRESRRRGEDDWIAADAKVVVE